MAIWAVVAAFVDSSSLPSPLEVWRAFLDGLRAGTIQEAAAKTLIRLAFSFAVADAHPLARAAAHQVTQLPGGRGAVREVCDALLEARSRA